MVYIYDILLNFCDCNLLYDFYEWDSSDSIENIKRIKLVHVEKNIFDDLLYYHCILDKSFLLKIYRNCEIYSTKRVKIVDYAFLISDGERVLALELDANGNLLYKSKLLLEEEEEISVLASNLEYTEIPYKRKNKVLDNRFFTRKEFVIRKYLIKEIEDSYRSKNYEKLQFLYEEYFDKKDVSYSKMVTALMNSMQNVIDNKHLIIYDMLRLSNKKKQV